MAVPLKLVVLNDAGVGKDDAGIAALEMLQARGVACATVSHSTARIGDALDSWEHGVLSHLNEAALALGLKAGEPLKAALTRVINHRQTTDKKLTNNSPTTDQPLIKLS